MNDNELGELYDDLETISRFKQILEGEKKIELGDPAACRYMNAYFNLPRIVSANDLILIFEYLNKTVKENLESVLREEFENEVREKVESVKESELAKYALKRERIIYMKRKILNELELRCTPDAYFEIEGLLNQVD